MMRKTHKRSMGRRMAMGMGMMGGYDMGMGYNNGMGYNGYGMGYGGKKHKRTMRRRRSRSSRRM